MKWKDSEALSKGAKKRNQIQRLLERSEQPSQSVTSMFNPSKSMPEFKWSTDETRILRIPRMSFRRTENRFASAQNIAFLPCSVDLQGWNQAYEKLKSMGNHKVDFQMAEGKGHAFFNYQPWGDITPTATDRFLKKLGYLKGEPTLPAAPNGEKLIAQP